MTDTLPKLYAGFLFHVWPAKGQYYGRIPAWKVWRYLDARVVGIAEEINDEIVGVIPAGVGLEPYQAGRAVGVYLKKVRELEIDPAFEKELERSRAEHKKTFEPRVHKVAFEILENPTNKPKDRLEAGYMLLGPKPAPGVQVNIQQNNASPAPCGYVINLGEAIQLAPPTIEEQAIPEPRRRGGR